MSSFTFRPGKRENVHLLIGLAGGTGSGKTMSAMRLAKGLAGDKPFAMIDTEARRGLHYADQFAFDHAELKAPFRPGAYLKAIKAAEAAGYGVILVDSMSHEWDGPGGLLEWHDELMGGKETKKLSSWILPKTEHRKFLNELLQLDAHVILCLRAQKKVEMVKDPQTGKWEIVEKQSLTGLEGWTPITEKNLPFELTMSLLLTAERPGIPHPVKLQEQHRPFVPLDAPITEATGAALARWAAGDDKAAEKQATADIAATIAGLEREILAFADDDEKRAGIQAHIDQIRDKHESDPGAFAAWLGAQLEKAKAKAAERENPDLDL